MPHATQLARGGELSRAQSVLEALPPMDRTPEVFIMLQSKFPPAGDEERASLRPLLEDLPSSVFDSSKWSEMLAAFDGDDGNFISVFQRSVDSLPRMSGTGTDRASFENIAALAGDDPGLVWHFAERRSLRGQIPPSLRPFFCCCSAPWSA